MKKIIAIVGARPQFIKHAPLEIELSKVFNIMSIHTGQHYDDNMSKIFFDQLNMKKPEYLLQIGSHSHGKQTGMMLESIETILMDEQPDAVLVYGDTNSTLAGSLAASKLHIPIVHVEAGLRSFNKKMPEEINRVVTDHISALLFAPTDTAIENLKNEGLSDKTIRTGDVMKDMVLIAKKHLNLNNPSKDFIYTTIHRPYNTDKKERLMAVLNSLNELSLKVKFSIHPRTLHKMEQFDLSQNDFPNIEFIPPQSYFKNIELAYNASALVTDSGGMQKEAYVLKTQCVTIRSETEWVETLVDNCNTLVFDNLNEIKEVLATSPKEFNESLYGNGDVGNEIATHILNFLD